MSDNALKKVEERLKAIIHSNNEVPVRELYGRYNINPKSKRCKQSLTMALIQNSKYDDLKEFVNQKNVWVKTAKIVRGGQLEASLSLPSFRFTEIVEETWEDSSLRKMLLETIFVIVFFKENSYGKDKDIFIEDGIIWRMPQQVIDSGVKKCWETVVTALKEGKVVKYIGKDGRYHTYFPRTSDGPYVHVRPHAATSSSTLPLPVPDKLTGLTEYQMHSFWLTRSYVQRILSQGDE